MPMNFCNFKSLSLYSQDLNKKIFMLYMYIIHKITIHLLYFLISFLSSYLHMVHVIYVSI